MPNSDRTARGAGPLRPAPGRALRGAGHATPGAHSRRAALASERTARARLPRRVRFGLLSLLAMIVVAGITATHALPAFAVELTEDGGGIPLTDAGRVDDLQRFSVPFSVVSRGRNPDLLQTLGQTGPSWTAPISGELRDGFGPRLALPVAGVSPFHRGQDIGASCGRPIGAAAAGTVVQAGWFGTYGNWVLIDHGNGVQTGYAHAASLSVRPGQQVAAGQPIAAVGTTGASTGCHLHLEMRVGGRGVDPVAFLAQQGVRVD